MNTIKLFSSLLCAAVLTACATTVDFKKSPATEPSVLNAALKLQCQVYHLPEFLETPKPPVVDFSNTSKVGANAQKTALVLYIDQLRTYIGTIKRDVNVSYMRYLMACVD